MKFNSTIIFLIFFIVFFTCILSDDKPVFFFGKEAEEKLQKTIEESKQQENDTYPGYIPIEHSIPNPTETLNEEQAKQRRNEYIKQNEKSQNFENFRLRPPHVLAFP